MLLFSWPESQKNYHFCIETVPSFRQCIKTFSFTEPGRNIEGQYEEYSGRWIFVVGIMHESLVKIKCLYSIQSIFSKCVVAV